MASNRPAATGGAEAGDTVAAQTVTEYQSGVTRNARQIRSALACRDALLQQGLRELDALAGTSCAGASWTGRRGDRWGRSEQGTQRRGGAVMLSVSAMRGRDESGRASRRPEVPQVAVAAFPAAVQPLVESPGSVERLLARVGSGVRAGDAQGNPAGVAVFAVLGVIKPAQEPLSRTAQLPGPPAIVRVKRHDVRCARRSDDPVRQPLVADRDPDIKARETGPPGTQLPTSCPRRRVSTFAMVLSMPRQRAICLYRPPLTKPAPSRRRRGTTPHVSPRCRITGLAIRTNAPN